MTDPKLQRRQLRKKERRIITLLAENQRLQQANDKLERENCRLLRNVATTLA